MGVPAAGEVHHDFRWVPRNYSYKFRMSPSRWWISFCTCEHIKSTRMLTGKHTCTRICMCITHVLCGDLSFK